MDKIQELIEQAQSTYYAGTPILSNEEYDALIRRYPEHERYVGPEGDHPHIYRMFSLKKVYLNRGDEQPSTTGTILSRKIDGCAISLTYIGGKLYSAITRGNGKKGRDVLHNVKQLNVPKSISQTLLTQITGEVTVTKEVENKRNYASGKINSKEGFTDAIGEAGLIFVAYGIQCAPEQVGLNGTYAEDMGWLDSQGFVTVLDNSGLLEHCPTDGTVVRINDNNAFNREGWTDKFPRGAWALKVDEEGEITTLRSVTWQVGASGKVTPVGHFDPIVIDDAVITKATLNNVDYIIGLGLELGCNIRVIRAGGVIPKIIGREDD
jgi:NAD-dependent DNA ligase